MIIKGKSRSGPGALAAHLGNAEANERVSLLETRGTLATDLRGSLIEMDAVAAGTRCEKPLYHAAISPAPPHRLTPQQRTEAVDALEEKLGLKGHARVVVLHEKHGREHIHVVWSRIDVKRMRSVSDSHNYRKHEEVARDLERRFGHDRVQGAHHERDGVKRPERTPSRSELRQEDRTGIKGKDVRAELTALYRASDGPEAFRTALEQKGYRLALGDRRDFVVVDRAGGIHSLARRIEGVRAAELREFMSPLDWGDIPTVEEARHLQSEVRKQRAAFEEDKLEAAYGRGGDYVTQSRAAQRDFERRQEQINKREDRDSTWDQIEKGEAERAKLERQAKAQEEADHITAAEPTADDDAGKLDNIEMTDRMRSLLSGMSEKRERASPDGQVDRQHEAPGGGRTRSR